MKVEVKDTIMTKFKAVMYAHIEGIYEEKKIDFLRTADGVQVRENKKYVSLIEQYLNKWDSCKEMWAPDGENANNRIERSFWTLRQSMKDRFPSLPVIQRTIIHLQYFCDKKILRAAVQVHLESLMIYDPDVHINVFNREAALVLNERGYVLFHRSLKTLQERREKMT